MTYLVLYFGMIICFTGLSIQSSDWRQRVIGILLALVNALIFYKGR